ncbi:nucleoside hydrolase [Pseudonocardiaceae bacterium YIM PH 21723]|nr:nucleoside hydrolase [Pseudonocardiaceae bacterium YIM PH 21723]
MNAFPLVVDTDPGVDDAFALALVAASPEADLRAVTTVFGNVGLARTTDNARRLLSLLGRSDVPVAAGAARPLIHPQPGGAGSVHGEDGLGAQSSSLPRPSGSTERRGAVQLIADVLRTSKQPVTIAAIGPLTNIALLLAAYPELKPRINRLVVMGGGFQQGNVGDGAEFNLWCDPEAAHRVLAEEDVPTTLVPLDLTMSCLVEPGWIQALRVQSSTGARLAAMTAPVSRFYRERHGIEQIALHDAVALLEALQPGTLACKRQHVDIDTSQGPKRGAIVQHRRKQAVQVTRMGREVDVATDGDLDRVRATLLARLSSLP